MSIKVAIDLRERLNGVRDQGSRPTCLTFATTSAHEVNRGIEDYLSVEYLHHRSVQRSHCDPRSGITAVSISAALAQDGQPIEDEWPYQMNTTLPDAMSVPTVTSQRYLARIEFCWRNLDDVYDLMSTGKSVVLILGISHAFYLPSVDARVYDRAYETTIAAHAVLAVAVGHEDMARWWLVRNSWGDSWGEQGHAWLEESYIRRRLHTSGIIIS